jgi:serine/threonine protein kinase
MVAMSVADIRSYMRGLLESLAHVHSHNIIHRYFPFEENSEN